MSMTLSRFLDLLNAYGAALNRWPEAEREAAAAFLETRPEARAAHADALALDTALNAQEVPVHAAALARMRSAIQTRIARTPLPDAKPVTTSDLRKHMRVLRLVRYAAFVVAPLLGIWIGSSNAAAPAPDLVSELQSNPILEDEP